MKHKTIQYYLLFSSLLFALCIFWARLLITRAAEEFYYLLLSRPGSIGNQEIDKIFVDLSRALLLPFSFFYLASLGLTMTILYFLFKDIRHATYAARYSLDQHEQDSDSLLPLDRSGETAGLQAAIQDLGAKARFAINHQKDEQLRLKDYLNDISHQLRTPLSSLRLYNDLLSRENKGTNDDRSHFILAQAKQIERMEWLITDLMTLARLDANAVEMEIEAQPLRPTIELAVEPFWLRASEEGKYLDVRCSPDIYIPHDRNWAAEAIANLIKNALEHTDRDGHIRIYCRETPLTVQIDIEDDGEGIDPADHPHIFERFYGKKSSRHPDSIGIGLALSKLILEKHDARIYAENRSGSGARFHIVFIKLNLQQGK